MNSALKKSVSTILNSSLKEDKVSSDITTKTLIEDSNLTCELLFKESGILCGTKIVNYLVKKFNNKIKIVWKLKEGSYVKKNTRVAIINGPGNKILTIERILLNFLQKTSGIATTTYNFCKPIKNKKINILDTRKTTPGWRLIEKYCVKIGGGENHRMDLSKLILIKDNHIKSLRGVEPTLTKLFKKKRLAPVEIEVKSLSQLDSALKFKIKRVMLDNFTVPNIKKAINKIRKYPDVEIEISGGIDIPKIKKISSFDVDYISVGTITHSSPSIDISMNVLK
ncbi:carboxylating nicotinate-nucleotide diphosphorylase [bacterium]|jgi:nicotinate-nucleotide pyrophosphorylase (carboxylating)|nr:carboxylating nicotinate-nucleotide diphosphorylase [bacterium]